MYVPITLAHFETEKLPIKQLEELVMLKGVEWVHGLLFPLVLGKIKLPHAKLGLFLCSLDNLLQKNIIVLFFRNQISKWCSFEKRAIFDLLFTFSSHHGKVTKIPSAHISLIHVFCSPYWLFCLTNFEKKIRIYQVRFSLVWVLVLILIRVILEQSINNKMVSKI